jgi:hypothetical protein
LYRCDITILFTFVKVIIRLISGVKRPQLWLLPLMQRPLILHLLIHRHRIGCCDWHIACWDEGSCCTHWYRDRLVWECLRRWRCHPKCRPDNRERREPRKLHSGQ